MTRPWLSVGRVIAALWLIGLATPVARAQLSFSDDFDAGPSPLWGNEVGGWFGAAGVYDSHFASNFPSSRSSLPFSLTDFTVEFDINKLQDGGIWLRSEEFPGGSIGRVGVLLVTGGHLLTGTGLYWHVVTDGSSYGGSLNEVTGLFQSGVSNAHLRVVVSGNDYAVYVNGNTTPATTLNTAAFSSGGMALYDFSPQTFDNLSLIGAPVGQAWNLDGDGAWSIAGNWLGGVPNSPAAAANLGSIITAARTVSVDIPVSVGTINLDNSQSYTLADAGGTITLDGPVGGAVAINVFAGSHTVSAPLVFNRDTAIRVGPAASTLAITGRIEAPGRTILKSGDGLLIARNVRAAGLNVAAGSLRVAAQPQPNSPAGTSVVQSLTIATGASLDLMNNGLVIDYTSAGTLASDIRAMLQGGRLTSSLADAAHRIGYGDNALLGQGTFAGLAVDGTSMLIKFTYAGDANLDGQVDISDLAALATAWQTSGVWTSGDFDYSGFVDITDLAMLATNWQAGVGAPLAMSFGQALASVGLGGVAVPEPATAIAMLGSAVAVQVRPNHRRHRRGSR